MKKVFIVLLLTVFWNSNATSATNIINIKEADCVEVSLDLIDVHEKYFGCLGADDATDLYNYLFSLCSIANDNLN